LIIAVVVSTSPRIDMITKYFSNHLLTAISTSSVVAAGLAIPQALITSLGLNPGSFAVTSTSSVAAASLAIPQALITSKGLNNVGRSFTVDINVLDFIHIIAASL